MMEILQEKNSRIAMLTTLGLFILLFLLFIFFGLKYQVPIPQQSIVINFGTSDDGSGPVQPENASATPSQPIPEVSNQPVSPSQNSPSNVATQDNSSPVTAPKVTETNPVNQPEKEPEREVNKQALFPGKNTNQKSGGSEGETGKPGDQGNPLGDKNSMSHTGSIDGNGNSYSLGLRKALVKPQLRYNCPEEGKVVVSISVDRSGKVVKVSPGARGTTNAAPCLLEKAREAAMQTKWEPDNDAPELQTGQIIYNFQLD